MSEKEKNKKKKKEKIIAGIVGSTILIAGAIAGSVASIPKAEAKGEEENKEKNKKPDPSNKNNRNSGNPQPAPTVVKPTPGNPSSPAPMPVNKQPTPNINSGNQSSAQSPKTGVLPTNNTAGGQPLTNPQSGTTASSSQAPSTKVNSGNSPSRSPARSTKAGGGQPLTKPQSGGNQPTTSSPVGNQSPPVSPTKKKPIYVLSPYAAPQATKHPKSGDLSAIKTLTPLIGLKWKADTKKPFSALIYDILNAKEFHPNPIDPKYSIFWIYDTKTTISSPELNSHYQRKGDFLIKIEASDLEPHWYDQTPYISITLD